MRSPFKFILPIIVVLGGLGAARFLMVTAPETERTERQDEGTLVEVATLETETRPLNVLALGQAVPAQQLRLQPQVSGIVEFVHPEFRPGGGIISAGEELIRIDQSEYRQMVNQADAERDQARALVEVEEGRGTVARREYDLFREDLPDDEGGRALVLREPQQREAEARVEMAGARLRLARLNLERTTIDAPFDLVVREEQVEVGQLVGPGSPLATLVGVDAYWVQVSLPVSDLPRIRIPESLNERGSEATIWQENSMGTARWDGHVVGLMADLDPVGRMARVIVQVEDPLHRRSEGSRLILGSFVHVEIQGDLPREIIDVPRDWLYEGERLLVMQPDDTLQIRPINIIWRGPDTVYVDAGVTPQDRIITTRLSVPVEGMALRLADEGTGEAAPPIEAATNTEAAVEDASTQGASID